MTEPEKLAYSIKDAAKALGLGTTTINRMIKDGRLKAVKIGGRTLIPAAALRAIIDNAPPA